MFWDKKYFFFGINVYRKKPTFPSHYGLRSNFGSPFSELLIAVQNSCSYGFIYEKWWQNYIEQQKLTFIFAQEQHKPHKLKVFHQIFLMAWAPFSYLELWLQGLLHIFHQSGLLLQDNSLRFYWSQDYKEKHSYFSSHLQFVCFQSTSRPPCFHHQSIHHIDWWNMNCWNLLHLFELCLFQDLHTCTEFVQLSGTHRKSLIEGVS